ncbi:Sec23-binding domain of Sec16-domain-containing protein [Amylocarpus encephaloides]|uniref:Protein transport protein sec16 n=1 Tax=Amylocarpus encephaloides TaxID=45428 RepID=A0A9P7Y7M2_9HELO|nr:Sec23-binding domain of Sec16-domain-containing protein [Amylocarpus encephaloides]
MSTESMAASWHPALMPNSSADVVESQSIQSSYMSAMPVDEPQVEASKPHPHPVPAHTGIEERSEIQNSEPSSWPSTDNVEYGESYGLPDELTGSLHSKGVIDVEEAPAQTPSKAEDHAPIETAEFHTESPNHENKHLSTMSFARTVSEDVNWGEDDEVDPEWNISRTDTDPFKMMAKSDRTNSFPAVPSLHNPALANAGEVLVQSQAEAIMDEVQREPTDMFGDGGNNDGADFFNQTAETKTGFNETSVLQPAESNGVENQDQSYLGNYGREVDQETQSRFEEGIPLVHPDANPSNDYGTPAFIEDDAGGEDDFFAQASKEDEKAGQDFASPPIFERKSTMQVMESMHFHPQDSRSPISPPILESFESTSDHALGGKLPSAVDIAPPGTTDDPINDQPATFEQEGGEVDLAEKWKAALAGDEFLDDDDDNELLPDDDLPEDAGALDPSALFGSDDEGFLDDNNDQNDSSNYFAVNHPPLSAPLPVTNGHVQPSNRPSSSSSRYLPPGASDSTAPSSSNNYAPTAPLLADLSRPTVTHSGPSPYGAATSSFPQHQERPGASTTQSFANRSKGGYESPYDLPMEVVKPRKRVSMQNMGRGYNATPPASVPPPRSSSMYTQPASPPRTSTASMSPPTSSHRIQNQQRIPSTAQPPKRLESSSHGFFEDLPMSSRPKPAPRHPSNIPTLSQSQYGAPSGAPQQQPPLSATVSVAPMQHQPPVSSVPSTSLVAPERVSPYASLPSNNMAPPPAVASRYSPAPPQSQPNSQTAPPPMVAARYSPAPPPSLHRQQSQPNAAPTNAFSPPPLAHQPRTSSPLAHFERNHDPRSYGSEGMNDRRTSSSGYESASKGNHLPPTREVDEDEQPSPRQGRSYGSLQPQRNSQAMSQPPPANRYVSQTPPPMQNLASQATLSSPKRSPSSYLPQQPSSTQIQPTFVPPRRSLTQSPGAAFGSPRLEMTNSAPYQRPASVEGPLSPRSQTGINSMPSLPSQGRPRGFSQGLNYVTPTDGREHDPLQRWRGAPVFAWGVGGALVTSFPKDVPRYGMNQLTPMIIRSPGEVKIANIKHVDPLQERLTSFPGPLKGKSKKKEVVTWLTAGIDILEQNASYLRTLPHLSHQDKRAEERILLWKILRVFIENDGILEGNPVVDKAVRAVLSPGLDDESDGSVPLYATGAGLSGISHSSNSVARSDPVDPVAVDRLRKHLLLGAREKAVWEAVDKRLWAHAMLISNTVSRDLYKQVAQEFVQKEVKNTGENTESLAALYEIFAGNFEESIDELVPASARAGFQMVSTSNSAGPSKDAMDGLDRWRETLGLVLSNRSVDDVEALSALGKLLSGYGRAEAAHICFLFARSSSQFGGIDDPASNMVLVGSDHLRQPYEFDKEMEPILLSEVFEYGMSLSVTANVAMIFPHLSVYKMQHASILAEYGYREQALQYCESIAGSVFAQTKRSQYHHALFVSALEDLSKRLKQSPKSEASSWLSKPSIDKVSGSVWDKLSKFVAGDENDTPASASNPAGGSDIGPFARIAGGTPTISRSPSNADLYGDYNGGLGINGAVTTVPASKVTSRYAPGRSYTPEPRSASYAPGRASMESRSSGEHQRYEPQRQMSDYRLEPHTTSSNYTPQTNAYDTPQSSFTPYGASDSPYAPQIPISMDEATSDMYSSLQTANNYDGNQMSAPDTPSDPSEECRPSGYEPPVSTGYGPPSGEYEPPSYEPATFGDGPDSPIDTRPKKSFMDDDDDTPGLKQAPASSPREKTKAEKDREADEAFRKAAEADAQKASAAPAKKGWGLGGWFGGGKKEPTEMAAQPNKTIRAKLGEASSFYYDPDLKRWVNKKGGDTAQTPSATPPPPKAGPPRSASGSGPPMSAPTSSPRPPPGPAMRAASEGGPKGGSPLSHGDGTSTPNNGSPGPALAPPAPISMSRTASNGSVNGAPSAPPSRPGTGMSNASSIDDLLGPATGGSRKGTAKKKKGRGYIDVMGDK